MSKELLWILKLKFPVVQFNNLSIYIIQKLFFYFASLSLNLGSKCLRMLSQYYLQQCVLLLLIIQCAVWNINKEKKVTVFLVEQNAKKALELADRGYVLVNGKIPMLLGLKDILLNFIDHRRLIIKRISSFKINKIKLRIHILEGFIISRLFRFDCISFV